MPFQLDVKYIKIAESTLGVIFPSSYKERMKQENGGEIETHSDNWCLYPFFDQSGINQIKRTANHIIVETNQAKSWLGFPVSAIAIASNGSGDQLVFLPQIEGKAELKENVYKWYHETQEVEKVANNFNELVNQV